MKLHCILLLLNFTKTLEHIGLNNIGEFRYFVRSLNL